MAPAATGFEEAFLMVMGSPKANACYGRSGLLHLAFKALDEFRATKGALPAAGSDADVKLFVSIAEAINGKAALKVTARHGPSARNGPSRSVWEASFVAPLRGAATYHIRT